MSIPASAPRDTETAEAIRDIRRLLEGELVSSCPLAAPGWQNGMAGAAQWLDAVRGKSGALRHPRLALFTAAGQPGHARLAVLQQGSDPLAATVAALNADLQVYEVPAQGTAADVMQAMAYGMTALQPGLDLLGLGCLDDHPLNLTDVTLDGLITTGRCDVAALTGAMLAARLARVPVVGAGPAYDYAVALLETGAEGTAAHTARAATVLGPDITDTDAAAQTAAAMAYFKSCAKLQN